MSGAEHLRDKGERWRTSTTTPTPKLLNGKLNISFAVGMSFMMMHSRICVFTAVFSQFLLERIYLFMMGGFQAERNSFDIQPLGDAVDMPHMHLPE